MTQQQSNYCFFLGWIGIGVMVCGLALAPVLTMYIKQQSYSVKTTTTTTATSISTAAMTSQTQVTQTSSSSTTGQAYYCGSNSSFTLWQTFGSNGLTMSINTSICSCNSTPLYFTSMAGITNHWILTGYGAIYGPTKSSVTIYAQSSSISSSTTLLSYSQTYQWNVNWFGLSN